MPDRGGLEVARHVRALGGRKVPLLVALSGWDDAEHRLAAEQAGFDHFLIKPIDPASLRVFLSNLVAGEMGVSTTPTRVATAQRTELSH